MTFGETLCFSQHDKYSLPRLVDLLLIKADLAWSHVHQQKQTSHNRQDLEEVVLREVLVRMMWVQLE
jgi:hypothetical protein